MKVQVTNKSNEEIKRIGKTFKPDETITIDVENSFELKALNMAKGLEVSPASNDLAKSSTTSPSKSTASKKEESKGAGDKPSSFSTGGSFSSGTGKKGDG